MATAVHAETQPREARWAVATIFFTNGLVVANWIARIPDVKHRLALSDGTLGFALLFMAAGALVGQPGAGWAIARFGSRAVTTAMAVLYFTTVVLLGFAPGLATLIGALFVVGAFNGALDVAMNAQAALVEERYARPIMASFHGLWSVGGLLGAAVGGLAASRAIPVGLHFVGAGAIGTIVALLATRELIPDGGVRVTESTGFALPPRSMLPLGLIAFCALLCEGAIGDWSAVYLRDGLGSAPGLAATGYAVFALLMAAGRLTGDRLTLRLGAARLVRASGALVAVGIGLALLGGSPWPAIAGFGLIGAGISCLFPVVLSAAARTPGIAPGTAIAAIATSGYTGFLVGPPLIGSLAEVATLRGALALLAVFGVLIVLLGAAVADKKRG